MSEVKKVLFIVNKFAGGRPHPGIDELIERTCRERGVPYAISFTEGPRHATSLASQAVASQEYKWIVAAGGDGTVNEVAQGMLHNPIPMGILPIGSGNGLARHLRSPMRTGNALRNLLDGVETTIDGMLVNGRLSINVSGIGFDGHIADHFGRGKKRGLVGYLQNIVREFKTFREFRAELITPDGSRTVDAFVIAIANSSQYGNNARIAPKASLRDGLIDVCILRKMPGYRLDLAFALLAGTIDKSHYYESIRARDLIVRLAAPVANHVDGEPCQPEAEFSITLMPGCLTVVVPKNAKKVTGL